MSFIQFLNLKPMESVKLSLTILLAPILIYIVVTFVKLTLFRKKYSETIATVKMHLFNPLGHFSIMPVKEESRNGYGFNVLFLQIISGFCQLFRDRKIYCLWISYVPFFIFVKADAVEKLISGTKVLRKSWSYKWIHPWLGTGLLTSQGQKWKSRRKLLTPSFHFDILKDFIPIFNEQSQILVKKLREETSKEFTDIVMPITLCSLDIICESTLGVKINAQENSESEYVKSVSRVTDMIMQRSVKPTYWLDFTFSLTKAGKQLRKDIDLLHQFTNSVIHEKKKKLLCGEPGLVSNHNRKALMDLLLEHHIKTQDLTEEDIREEVDTFAFAGHDTTSMGMSWALYLIGLHKDVQKKVHEEIDRIFEGDTERHITKEDLNEMVYLDQILKESQRLYPSVPMIARETTEEINICGYNIPAGCTCTVLTYELHRDKDVFPDPEKFDPDRFLPENCINRHPFAYVPFSAGPRNCIGQRFAVMEEKLIVANILRNYTLESLDPRDKIPPASELILRPAEPVRVKIRSRLQS